MATKYLKKYALRVVEAGYDICFIRPGEKRPFGKNWEEVKHDESRIASAIEAGRGGFGVGIKTRKTPGVDIDCYDADLVAHMVAVTEDLCGETLQRVGMPPKTLLVYRAKKPFPKTQSKTFIDDEGRAVKLEVLADGQQFVALHIHPDTEEPYRWKDKRSILDVEHADLPLIDQDDALDLVAEFERQCRKRGWPEKSTVKRLALTDGTGRERRSDAFLSDKSKVDLTPEQLLKKLHSVPNASDYDTWFHVGMALYHQFDGAEEGRLMWHEWSSSALNYDMDALDEKWDTFDIEGKKREPITARFIIKQAIQEEERLAGEELDEVRDDIRNAKDHRQFQAVMDKLKHIQFPPMMRESLVLQLRDQIKKATGSPMPISMLRKQCAFENPEHRATPAWLRNWVFIQQDESFYHLKTRQTMTTKAFDLSHGRYLLTKKDILEGVSTPENSASHIAVHRFQIPTVANKMYLPNEEEFFEANRLMYVNSYSDATIPETPETLSARDRKMCSRIEKHLEHLFESNRDRKLFLSWLAYIVQTGKKVNWSPVVQGVEGDGKSFFGRLMAVVLGGENVNIINGDALAEQYTSWAEGSQFLMVEEVRLHGADRFAVINKIKPYITNDMVTVRRMRTDTYKVINTVNYFLTTNFKDGVPADANSTRYFPMFSKWQTRAALDEFNEKNPDYYAELHEVLDHGGAVRRWLLDYPLHKDFNPIGRAKESSSMAEMRFLNQSGDDNAFKAIVDREEEADLTKYLVDSKKIRDKLLDSGLSPPAFRQWNQFISGHGFTHLGEFKVSGKNRNYWSQEPDRFRGKDGKFSAALVRAWIESGWELDI